LIVYIAEPKPREKIIQEYNKKLLVEIRQAGIT
jgi:hypothetical protein